MKWLALVVFILSFLVTPAFADLSNVHQQTSVPTNARYEIVQSELVAQLTFRLDRFTGHVAQCVKTSDGGVAWEEMSVINLPKPSLDKIIKGVAPSRPHFQIFTSGLVARYTFLIDTDTGKTWQLVTSKRKHSDGTEYEVDLWEPFAM